ncbi:hypothetical protein F5I97DRAFT_1900340 [Phlebopus sp. FC_14]|nr:hypothetical protein F5I97DRAFT_1900340 [Phlebopus sp. FC_14]
MDLDSHTVSWLFYASLVLRTLGVITTIDEAFLLYPAFVLMLRNIRRGSRNQTTLVSLFTDRGSLQSLHASHAVLVHEYSLTSLFFQDCRARSRVFG